MANAVDESRVGAAGLSLGGLTTLLVSFHPRLHDERIKAAVPIAALGAFFAAGFYHTRALPLLLIHGDLDAFIDYERNARRAFMRAAPNARLVPVAKGTHAAFGAQLDPTTIALLNALIGPPDADPSNPDGLGLQRGRRGSEHDQPRVPECTRRPRGLHRARRHRAAAVSGR